MKYLLSNKFKKPGWFLFIIGIILGVIHLIDDFESDLLTTKVISLFHKNTFFGSEDGVIRILENSIVDELITLMIIIGGLLVSLSKEKIEDEFITQIRLDSFVWAILVNYLILLFATIFIYDIQYFNVLVFNMFTPLIIFVLRFNYVIYKKNSHEE
ncbi:hypothetical protein [Aquimarina sp. 2201CG5-10]|uniref:hypothetical protein n=1 Tax=Aquimarina callyspongiae TaxID=3098150 RepID=UPI002AB33E9E|nr:hypothetical protein [Aquimarina sp. 2201CG5-10]MDY8136318.1 hypothetical protein [Aquimarina sp. 2201CG5-10]